MKKIIFTTIIVIIVGAGWYWYSMKSDNRWDAQNTVKIMEIAPRISVKEISISSKNFEFSEKEIRVKKGDRIKINLTSTGGTHDWVVDEFSGAKTSIISTEESSSAEFTADKTGTFEYYCSVGTHRQMGMVGRLIVE